MALLTTNISRREAIRQAKAALPKGAKRVEIAQWVLKTYGMKLSWGKPGRKPGRKPQWLRPMAHVAETGTVRNGGSTPAPLLQILQGLSGHFGNAAILKGMAELAKN